MASNGGSFRILVPRFSSVRTRERFKTVGKAVVRFADLLGADITVSQKRNLLSVWVYYSNSGEKWIPAYCDWGKDGDEDSVFRWIRSELYHLSRRYEGFVLQSTPLS